MSDIRLQIPDETVENIQAKVGKDFKATDIAKDAITLYNWAVGERAKGNIILSSDPNGDKMIQLAMPSIERANPDKAVKGNPVKAGA